MSGFKLRLFGKRNRADEDNRRRILFVSHEATLTGAPKIILNILRHFRKNCDARCETILHQGGQLAEEFEQSSDSIDCLNVPRQSGELLQKRLRRIVQRHKSNPPILAFCNSLESRFVTSGLAQLGVPSISLVHELPSSYADEDYHAVYRDSKKVVFPVETVRAASNNKVRIPSGKSVVIPQGLLDPKFGTRIGRVTASTQIRKELGLPADSFIVLGCGTLDLRKGIDHFAIIARRVIEQNGSNNKVHFVWIGEGPRWPHSPFHYIQMDLEKTGTNKFIHFIGERLDVEPFFMGSDVFLLSSRVDPFPCVIHEAMAARLPIIAFENSGGAKEAIDGGAGFVVPFANYEQTSSLIRMLANEPEVAASIRERCRERVNTKYRFQDYGDSLIDLAENITQLSLRNKGWTPTRRAA